EPRPPEGMNRGTVSLVKRRFEYVGNAQLLAYLDIAFSNLERQLAGFQHIHASEQHEWFVIGDINISNCYGVLGHDQDSLRFASAASTKPLNNGWPSRGVEVNSGWNWQ